MAGPEVQYIPTESLKTIGRQYSESTYMTTMAMFGRKDEDILKPGIKGSAFLE